MEIGKKNLKIFNDFDFKKVTRTMEEKTAEFLLEVPSILRGAAKFFSRLLPIKKAASKMEEITEYALDSTLDAAEEKLLEWEYTPVPNFLSKKFLAACSGCMALLIIGTFFIGVLAYRDKNQAFCVKYDGEPVFYVSDIDEFEEIVKEKEKSLSDFHGYEKRLTKPFTYESAIVPASKCTSEDDIRNFVSERTEGMGYGYELSVNGERLALIKNKEDLEAIKERYLKENTPKERWDSSTLKEKPTISKIYATESSFKTVGAVVDTLEKNFDEAKYHIISEGESLALVAEEEKVNYNLLRKLNPSIPLNPPVGTKVKLNEGAVFTVLSSEVKTYDEALRFETEIKENASLYDSRSYVEKAGENGVARVVDMIYYENNEPTKTERISAETLKQPVKKVVVKGTKETPKYMASGRFAYPTRGRFTSGFGRRWGRLHKGIDLANSIGTKVCAADGGTVVFAGFYHGLGKMVKIDHGNGYETVYGHLSKFAVSKGYKVGKGEIVGYMGSTGYSTGSHLHFEVHKNGVPQNPLKYLK